MIIENLSENLSIEENNLISLAISSYKNGNSVDWELFPVKRH